MEDRDSHGLYCLLLIQRYQGSDVECNDFDPYLITECSRYLSAVQTEKHPTNYRGFV
jgi:hypothetical protein